MTEKAFGLVVFASGTGSNFRAVYDSIKSGKLHAEVLGLITNNPDAGARKFAEDNGIAVEIINGKRYPEEGGVTKRIMEVLEGWSPDLIILAGYMKKLDRKIVAAYATKILNIHPALLPSFGGKGMYGLHVHEAVLEYGVKFTGVTVHVVDFDYDAGPIVMQRIVPVLPDDTPEILQQRVLKEEHAIYSEAIKLFAEGKASVEGRKVILQD
ncbi:phosphoribosylglycinamide formyltransferase [candidate division KSB1 bacterium]